jgi:YfiH family protein
VAGCSTRVGGASKGNFAHGNLATHVGDALESVEVNREDLRAQLCAQGIIWLRQVHGTDCVYVDEHDAAAAPEADAMWTDRSGLALAILTADCVPVVLWADDASVIGVAHAGWRGLCAGVVESLVAAIPVPADQLSAWIGPCISQPCYEVGEEVWSQFSQLSADVLAPSDTADKRLLDLAATVEHRLGKANVKYVSQSSLCSFSDRRFYSYRGRRGIETGRMASFALIRPN